MQMQTSAAAPALSRPVRGGVLHHRLVHRELEHPLVDEGAALPHPRRVVGNKACLRRRWGGPFWVHEAPSFRKPEVPQTPPALSPLLPPRGVLTTTPTARSPRRQGTPVVACARLRLAPAAHTSTRNLHGVRSLHSRPFPALSPGRLPLTGRDQRETAHQPIVDHPVPAPAGFQAKKRSSWPKSEVAPTFSGAAR